MLQHALKSVPAWHVMVIDAMLFLHLQTTETAPPSIGGDFALERILSPASLQDARTVQIIGSKIDVLSQSMGGRIIEQDDYLKATWNLPSIQGHHKAGDQDNLAGDHGSVR